MASLKGLKPEELEKSFQKFILSPSGWRKVFAIDGDEDSLSAQISESDIFLTLLSVNTIAQFWFLHSPRPVILVGSDTRPTSENLLDVVTHELYRVGCHVLMAGTIPIPELAACCQKRNYIDGFFYVSASHNPPGYNGFKFGRGDGKILPASECNVLINDFKENMQQVLTSLEKGENISLWQSWLQREDQVPYPNMKAQAYRDYIVFLQDVAGGGPSANENEMLIYQIKKEVLNRPLGILIDYNGSSRIFSCDRDYLEQFGVQTAVMGDTPGKFDHEIVPEGKGLQACQEALARQYERNSAYRLGYVPDCDGDRGNLVVYDENKQEAIPLEAQTGFSLCVLSELAYLKRSGAQMSKVAVVVNDATSLRVAYICRVFGAQIFVAETGEANIIEKAAALREQGYIVRMYGEGSNGGNITYPSTGRDPLNTLTSIIKLLYLRGESGLVEIWCQLNQIFCPREFDLFYILTTFPNYHTTNVFAKESLLTGISDQAMLKKNYERAFIALWPEWQPKLYKTLAIVDYRFISYEAQDELLDTVTLGPGGVRVMLYQENQHPIGFFWMRASKTEPVLRLMVDIEHHSGAIYQWLYRYHHGLLSYAAQLGNDKVDLRAIRHLVL